MASRRLPGGHFHQRQAGQRAAALARQVRIGGQRER
jgi:hypothetical protein